MLTALGGPWVAPYSPTRTIGPPYVKSFPGSPLGTDYLGRDVLSRVLSGGRDLLVLPLVTTALATGLGVLVGMTIGYLGGRSDRVTLRLIDATLAIPGLLVLLVIVTGFGASTVALVVAVTLTEWPFIARLTRAATLQVLTSAYVEQARAAGEQTISILFREILPNIAGTILANTGIFLVGSFYLVASASYLGFVANGTTANWAGMINENIEGITLSPYSVVVPIVLIVALAISVNVCVDRFARRITR